MFLIFLHVSISALSFLSLLFMVHHDQSVALCHLVWDWFSWNSQRSKQRLSPRELFGGIRKPHRPPSHWRLCHLHRGKHFRHSVCKQPFSLISRTSKPICRYRDNPRECPDQLSLLAESRHRPSKVRGTHNIYSQLCFPATSGIIKARTV